MKLIHFDIKHLHEINSRSIDIHSFKILIENIKEKLNKKDDSEFFTIVDNDRVVACGGVHCLWKGVGELWLSGSDLIKEKPIAFHKTIVSAIKMIVSSGKWHRLQSVVRSDFREGLSWNRLLGFKIEGKMERYTPDGVDCFLYRMEGI